MNKMFCYQCEQTMKGTGCITQGVCGKSPQVSDSIDKIMYVIKQASIKADGLRKNGQKTADLDRLVIEGLFTTVTNVNFDTKRYDNLLEGYKNQGIDISQLSRTPFLRIDERISKYGQDIVGLQELLVYGLKGMAAYTDHAMILGQQDDAVFAFFHEALAFLAEDPTDENKLIQMIFKCGEMNLKVMEMLDMANTSSYGHPEPTKIRITPIKGKAILVSGHDLKDLETLLKQTEGKGINIYTHGEMLPCNAYPGLKKYKHLVGNYGGAWQEQQKEFAAFPGPILMTTNCVQKPLNSYSHRIFTTGLVGWEGIRHIADKNFTPIIDAALKEKGFEENSTEKFITIGFGHNSVLKAADKIVEAVKANKIRHFFLIGGCDGAKPGRNYYTEFAQKVPNDCIILTLACGKYRFNKLDFGEIGGIPRLLDMGQCNDAYSAIQVALALSKVFNTDVNSLPLSLILSWYEQKAVVILLTLLFLGIKNIRLGPSLPAFVTPPTLKVLMEKFNIMPIKTVDEDLNKILEN